MSEFSENYLNDLRKDGIDLKVELEGSGKPTDNLESVVSNVEGNRPWTATIMARFSFESIKGLWKKITGGMFMKRIFLAVLLSFVFAVTASAYELDIVPFAQGTIVSMANHPVASVGVNIEARNILGRLEMYVGFAANWQRVDQGYAVPCTSVNGCPSVGGQIPSMTGFTEQVNYSNTVFIGARYPITLFSK